MATINLTPALSLCQESVLRTACIIQDLTTDMARRRSGKLRAAWKKQSIKAYLIRVERAKSSLAMSFSVYQRYEFPFEAQQTKHIGSVFMA